MKVDLELYPNPASSSLNINYPQAGVLEIADMTGRQGSNTNPDRL